MQCSGIIESMSMPEEELMIDCSPVSDAAPVVIGGVGGSGTRVFAQLLQDLGFDMGSDLNESLDDLGFTALFKRSSLWPLKDNSQQLYEALALYLRSRGHPPDPIASENCHQRAALSLFKKLEQEGTWRESGSLKDRLNAISTTGHPSTNWGWKEPNSHIFLPYLLGSLPNMKYVHVVRHGLDMASSNNTAQLMLWGPRLLQEPPEVASQTAKFNYWCEVHRRLLKIHDLWPANVLLLRFESLFSQPSRAGERLAEFLKNPNLSLKVKTFIEALDPPKSLGRHKSAIDFEPTDDQVQLLLALGY
jgi:hypothetical protein